MTHPDRYSARKAAGFGAQLMEAEAHRPADFQRLPYVEHLRAGGKPDTPSGQMGTVDSGAVDHVLKDGAGRVTRINETTRAQLKKLIQEGLEQGLSPAELGDRIQAATAFSEYRAERIARTELMFAYNQGALVSYGKYGVTQVEAADGDKDDECSARNGKVFSVLEAMSIEDHPNGTLDWIPIAANLTAEATAPVAPKPAKVPKVAEPPKPAVPTGMPKWSVKHLSHVDDAGKQWFKKVDGSWTDDAAQAAPKAPPKVKLPKKPKTEFGPNNVKWVDDPKTGYHGWATKQGQPVDFMGNAKWKLKTTSAPAPAPAPAPLPAGKVVNVSNVKNVPGEQSSTGYIDKLSGKPVKKLPDGSWVETGDPTINPKGYHVWQNSDGSFSDHLTNNPIKFNPTTKQWEPSAKPVSSTASSPSATIPKPTPTTKPQVSGTSSKVDSIKKRGEATLDKELRGWQGDIGDGFGNGPKLTHEQWKAMNHYTGSGSSTYNNYLRGKLTPKSTAERDAWESAIDSITSGMQPLPYDMVVKRGVGYDAFGLDYNGSGASNMFVSGARFGDPGFMSTSTKSDWSGWGNVDLEIAVPKGTRGLYVKPISSIQRESEVLLDKGQSFVIDQAFPPGIATKWRWLLKVHIE